MKGARRAWLLRARRIRSPPRTLSLCTSSPCMVALLPPVAGPALASALPHHSRARSNCVRSWPRHVLLTPPVHLRLCFSAARAHVPGSTLRATARSGPLASARAPLLRSQACSPRPAPAHAASFRTPARCCRLSQRAPRLARPRREPPAPHAIHTPAPPTRPPLQSPLAPRAARTPALRRLPRATPTPAPLARSASARPRARARPSVPLLARAHALALAPHVPQLRCLDSRQPE
jgi:hypothetical protein